MCRRKRECKEMAAKITTVSYLSQKSLSQNKAVAQKQTISAGYSNNLQWSEGPALTGKYPLHTGLSGLRQCTAHIENLTVKTQHVSSHILFQNLSLTPTFLIIYRLKHRNSIGFLRLHPYKRVMQCCNFVPLFIQL